MDISTMHTFESRLASFNKISASKKNGIKARPAWPLKATQYPLITPEALAHAGWYYASISGKGDGRDLVQCFLCEKQVEGWEKDDDPFREHYRKQGGICGWADTKCWIEGVRCDAEETEVDFRDLLEARCTSSETTLPQSKESFSSRLKTFGDWWPHASTSGPSASNMAKAGFIASPTSDLPDSAVCLYCDLSLDMWAEDDDPMLEHSTRSPRCVFFTSTTTTSSHSHHNHRTNTLNASTSTTTAIKAKSKAPSRKTATSTVHTEEYNDDEEDAPPVKKARSKAATKPVTALSDDEPEGSVVEAAPKARTTRGGKKAIQQSVARGIEEEIGEGVSGSQEKSTAAPAPKVVKKGRQKTSAVPVPAVEPVTTETKEKAQVEEVAVVVDELVVEEPKIVVKKSKSVSVSAPSRTVAAAATQQRSNIPTPTKQQPPKSRLIQSLQASQHNDSTTPKVTPQGSISFPRLGVSPKGTPGVKVKGDFNVADRNDSLRKMIQTGAQAASDAVLAWGSPLASPSAAVNRPSLKPISSTSSTSPNKTKATLADAYKSQPSTTSNRKPQPSSSKETDAPELEEQLPELDEKDLNMKVEEWLRRELQLRYEELKKEGEEKIEAFRKEAEKVRMEIERNLIIAD